VNQSLVSIIVPVFNSEAYLGTLLSSLFEQTERSFEVLAVDDGSSDRSGEILSAAAARDARLKVLHEPHRGVAAARNRALDQARGTWIAFADSDDWLAPELLSTWVERAESQALDLLIGNYFRFSNDPQRERASPCLHSQPWDEVISGTEWIIHGGTHELPPQVWLQLVRRDFLQKVGIRFTEGVVQEDISWTFRLALAAQRVGFSKLPLYGYRQNVSSITQSPCPFAVKRRVDGYLVAVDELEAAALNTQDRRLRSALMHVVVDEAEKCHTLLRKRLRDRRVRGEAASAVLRSRLTRILLRRSTTLRRRWLGLRGLASCLYYVAVSRLPGVG